MTLNISYFFLYLGSVFLSAVSQVLLKRAALDSHDSVIAEYINWRVLLGYTMFLFCTLLTMISYRGIPLSLGPVLESISYLYVTFFGVVIFHEKVNAKKIVALIIIIVGVIIYSI